jgi:putative redox protein
MDVISILQKKRQDIREFEVSAVVDQAEQHPKVFTKIVLTYSVTGLNISKEAVERAVELSEKRYCGAKAMLQETAEITNRIVINEID